MVKIQASHRERLRKEMKAEQKQRAMLKEINDVKELGARKRKRYLQSSIKMKRAPK